MNNQKEMQKIIIKNVNKTYKIIEKKAGFKGSVEALFKKSVSKKNAISQFNLEIKEGEIVGLIGENGAGKTTLIKMLIGVIQPTAGEISVFGYTPYELKDEFKKTYAVVMGQKSQLWWDLPAVDSFLLNKELYDINDDEYKSTVNKLVTLFRCEDLLNVQVRNLSLGERMKMELIVALIHNPKILFLDEPTIGLDAVSQKQIREFLKQINSKLGVTILLTSHYMKDIESLCSRAVLLRKGQKIYDGSLDGILKENQEKKRITLWFNQEPESMLNMDFEWVERDNQKWIVQVKKEDAKVFLKEAMDLYDVFDVSIEDESLSDVIEKIYKGKEEI